MGFGLAIIALSVVTLLILRGYELIRGESLKKLYTEQGTARRIWEISAGSNIEIIDEATAAAQMKAEEQAPMHPLLFETIKRLDRAGFAYRWQKVLFISMQVMLSFACSMFLMLFWNSYFQSPLAGAGGAIGGLLIGYIGTLSYLDRKIAGYQDEIRRLFPGVVDNLLVLVSGGLSLPSAILSLVALHEEHGDYDPAMTLLSRVVFHAQKGLSLEEAFLEVANKLDIMEVRQTFKILAQCERLGGNVKDQLTAVADSLLFHRQVNIDEKIAALPVRASVPLAMIFGGFFAFLFATLFVTIARSGFGAAF